MPKISKHGGPTHAGVTPPRPAKKTAPADVAPLQVRFDLAGTDEQLRNLIRRVVRVESEHGPELPPATGGVVNSERLALIGEDDSAQPQEHPGHEEPMTDTEAPADSSTHELTTDPEGGEQPSLGSSSTASTKKPPTTSAPSKTSRPKRARATGSPSATDPTASSSAPSTAGDPTAPTSNSDQDTSANPA